MKELTKDEQSILLYIETRAVDYRGRLDSRQMSLEDYTILKRWYKEGFVFFSRIKMTDMDISQTPQRYWTDFVILSPEAWQLAHETRMAKAKRALDKAGIPETVEEYKTDD